MRPGDYREVQQKYRPSHADYTYEAKYGVPRLARAAAARARARPRAASPPAPSRASSCALRHGVEIVAWVSKVGAIARRVRRRRRDPRARSTPTPIRCPDPDMAARMIAAVEAARKEGNSLGGVVTCAIRGCPPGWGEPVFDKLEADLAKSMLSLPATKGFEIGWGFAGTLLTGREHNDEFFMDGDRIRTRTNRSGGIQGGITNGETLSSASLSNPPRRSCASSTP